MGIKWKQWQTLFSWAPKSLWMVTAAMKLKDICFLEEKLWQTCCCCWVAKSCPTLCNPIDSSPPGSPVPGILQARTLEWVAISSNAWKWKVKVKSLSLVWLLATSWTAAYQAPPSMGFSRQEYWSGVPLPSPEWSMGSSIKDAQKLSRPRDRGKGLDRGECLAIPWSMCPW